MKKDIFNLQRFIETQNSSYEIALNEIKNERKQSHWMWYIFPQFKGLGRSYTAEKYAIQSKEEAIAYFQNPILKERLIAITTAFLHIENKTAYEILGSPDDLKMKSSMTLFNAIQNETTIFKKVLDKFYNSINCEHTLNELNTP
ncbi:MAG: DUF1810 domain-containing protein [Tenacibaculum sp.]|nr:DUF1810 domain-containing protein [Tenacibaculum sp.]